MTRKSAYSSFDPAQESDAAEEGREPDSYGETGGQQRNRVPGADGRSFTLEARRPVQPVDARHRADTRPHEDPNEPAGRRAPAGMEDRRAGQDRSESGNTQANGRAHATMEGAETDHEGLGQQWHQIRVLLREELGDTTYESWLRPLDVLGFNDGCITMSVPTRFMRDWVERKYAERLRRHWTAFNPAVNKIEILLNGRALPPSPAEPSASAPERSEPPARSVAPARTGADDQPAANDTKPQSASANGRAAPADDRPTEEPRAAPAVKSVASSSKARAAEALYSAELDEDVDGPIEVNNTFDTFVVGKSNELAHAAARRVAESSTVPFNPLFLHGSTGLGKTHLMHAIAWEVRQRYPEKKVIYLSAEKFMYQFVAAIRHHNQFAFKKQFRSVDLLMIDDFQYIAGKGNTQEEFFHTFNTLVDHSRQVVISADRSPSDLDGVEERIRSRLSWGLVADIHPTDFELRLGILQVKAHHAREIYGPITIPQAVLDFLAHKIVNSVRELEGALHRILAHAALVGRPINVEMAQDVLRPMLRANARKITVEEIQRKVAEFFGLKVADLLSPRRARNVSRPRQIAMYLAKQLTTRSLPDIGRRFGNRDHTTVMHAVKRIGELRRTDAQIDEAVENLRRLLEA